MIATKLADQFRPLRTTAGPSPPSFSATMPEAIMLQLLNPSVAGWYPREAGR